MNEPPPLPQWTLRRRIGRTFIVSGLLFVLISASTLLALLRLSAAGDEVIMRRQPASLTSQRLLIDVRAQAAALADYAATADDEFRSRYYRSVATEKADLAMVRRLVGSDSEMLTKLNAFDAAVTRWEKQVVTQAIAAVKFGVTFAAVTIVNSPAAKAAFAPITTASDDLVALADRRVEAGRHARSFDRQVVLVVLGSGVLLVLAAGVAVWRGMHRWVLGPIDRLGAQTRIVAAGATRREITPDGPKELAMLGSDVEAMRGQIAEQLTLAEEIQDELARSAGELARSNADLQQFAYVASHDLSEPLRKVANFCQLLERQYGEQLDDRARQYIDFAVDGARRMQVLIADLLALSRVGRTTEAFVPVDLSEVIARAELNLSYRIAESGAQLKFGRLPIVSGDPALLGSLFDNLIGNAIKYRRPDETPVVHIDAEHESSSASWQFVVADNGIGIEPQYGDRIFQVFQRLHLRDEYGGTGIGLAMCRKIVEFHGGRIWLDTGAPGSGATFRFTLPEGGPHAAAR